MRTLLVATAVLVSLLTFAPTAAAHPVHLDCKGLEIWVVAWAGDPSPDGGLVCIGAQYSVRDNICHSGELGTPFALLGDTNPMCYVQW